MTKAQAVERLRRVLVASGMTAEEVTRQVARGERQMQEQADGSVVALTSAGTPWAVADDQEPVDYLAEELLEAVPAHVFPSAQKAALRFAALPHRAGQRTAGQARRGGLEERMGMRGATTETDELSRRLGRLE